MACLGAMREYVVLCHKLRILPTLLEQIEASWGASAAPVHDEGLAGARRCRA